MGSFGDDFDALIAESRGPAPKKDITISQSASKDHIVKSAGLGVIKGDFAKTMAPTMGEISSFAEDLDREVKKQSLGYSPPKTVVVTNQKETADILHRPKSFGDTFNEALKESGSPVTIGMNRPQRGDTMLARFGENAKPFLTALSIEEHMEVKALSKFLGFKEREDISDYTFRGLLGELGAADNLLTDATGLMLSIMAVPSTYLSFGTSAALKLGVRSAFTREGRAVVDKIIRDTAHTRILQTIEGKGRPVTDVMRNKVIAQTKADIEQQVLKRFGEINSVNKKMSVLKIVESLPENIMSKRGAKFDVPFSGGKEIPFVNFNAGDVNLFGKTVLSGKTIASIVHSSGLAKVPDLLRQSEALEGAIEFGGEVKNAIGNAFIHEYGIDQNLVRAFRSAGPYAERLLENPGVAKLDAIKKDTAFVLASWKNEVEKSDSIRKRIYERTGRAFNGWTPEQKTEFASISIDASTKAKKVTVTSPTGDKKVQNALDHWFGQGTYKGKGLAEQFAEKSLLIEDKRLSNWFPGIKEDSAISPSLRLPAQLTPAKREFLKKRAGEAEKYTKDPVKAIATRATEIAFANIQDKFFTRMVEGGLGDVKRFNNPAEAFEAGYAPLVRPFAKNLSEGVPFAKRVDEPTFYAKQEFVEQYNKLVKGVGSGHPVLDLAGKLTGMSLWKPYVTSVWSAFHARNFNSNIILNAMRIGGHAIEPKKFAFTTEAVLRRGEGTEAKGVLDKAIRMSTNLVFGKNKEKTMTNVLGETFTQKSLIEEAEKFGAIRTGFFQADIGGAGLSKTASELWGWQLNKLNPLGENFIPRTMGTKFGDAVETQARLVNYLTWRIRGLSPRMAAKETGEALYDYGAITGFEKALNQNIIPFYTFRKKNIENYLKLASYRPSIVLAQMKMFRDIGPTEEELDNMPEWARRRFILNFKGAFYSNGAMPIEDILEIANAPVSQAALSANPVLRYLGERAYVKKDIYSGRSLDELNNANEFKGLLEFKEWVDQKPGVPALLKGTVHAASSFLKLERDQENPNKIIGDPNMLHILRSGFTSRFQSTIGMLSKEDKPGYEKAMQFFLGIVRLEENPELQLYIEQSKARKEVRKAVTRRNLARPIDLPYFVGEGAKEANDWIGGIKGAVSKEELKGIVKEAEELSTEYQKGRTE